MSRTHFATHISWSSAVLLGSLAFSGSAIAETPEQAYQAKQQQYEQQQQDYQEQRAQYDDALDRYRFERTHPGWWWSARYERASAHALYDVDRPSLVGVQVVEPNGSPVARIRNMDTNPDGSIDRIQIRLSNGRVSWLDRDELRYDREDRIAFTNVPWRELSARARDVAYEPRP